MDLHITRELLRGVARGDVSPKVLVDLGLRHLTQLCPHCHEEYAAWQHEQAPGFTYDSAFKVLPMLLERRSQAHLEREKAAKRDCQELLKLSHAERLNKIRRSTTRFRGPALVDLLLEESKSNTPAHAREAFEIAELAEAVLLRSPAEPGTADLAARAAAYMGNASRILENNQEAQKRFGVARRIIRNEGVTDPLVCAEIDSCEAVFYIDLRRFAEAEELLTRSIMLYSLVGETGRAAHPLLTLGTLYYYQGDSARAIEVTQAAADSARPGSDRRLYMNARHNLVLYLCEAERYTTALEILETDQELYRVAVDRWTQLRWTWIRGKIAAGLGQADVAEQVFREVRAGFVEGSFGYDVAMVSLDLALTFVKQGRTAELKGLASSMHAIFEAQEVHREAAAALILFQEAASQETLTPHLVEDLASYLKKARHNPALRFKKRRP
jgi:tetratricopeptide (TPR) repeat protein